MAARFSQKPIDFVSINVFDDLSTVRKFLKTHPIEGVVALDGDPGTADEYGLEGIPVTVLIRSNGRIAAITHPSEVSSAVLEELLSGDQIQLDDATRSGFTQTLPRRHSYISGNVIGPEDMALLKVVVMPTAEEGGLVSGPDQFESTGVDLRLLLSYAYNVPPFHIFLPSLVDQERYKVEAWVPKNSPETLRPLLRTAIASAAGIAPKLEKRDMDAYILEGFPGKLAAVPAQTLLGSICGSNQMTGNGVSVAILQNCLEEVVGKSVILPAGVNGTFRYSLKWRGANISTFLTALKEDLGLTLKPTRKQFDVLVVQVTGP